MGQLKTDGKAIDVVAPAGLINFGDLYRIDGFSGFAMDTIAVADTVRDVSLEISERIWYAAVPAGTAAARGDLLYWTAGAGLKSGATDLTATITGGAIAKTEEVRNAGGYAAVRLCNVT